ncbi:MAG: flagellar hook-length control protein FliK, partial [Gammaproteobacteria bacterium]
MAVSTIPMPVSGAESSSKLLNSNSNADNTDGGLSFNATMNEAAANFDFDDQRYRLPDGQVISAQQLLEMLENGNPLPAMNLPSLSELQNYKFQQGLDNPDFKPVINVTADGKTIPGDATNKLMNDKFALTQQQFPDYKINQDQVFKLNQSITNALSLKAGASVPEQFLVSLNTVTASVNTDMPGNNFSAAYGYQFSSGPEGTTGVMSNSFSIATPVQHPQWNQSLGQSVQWMVNNNMQQAEIKLNPPDLGMLDIRITVTNDQATVHFTAQNSAVRDALESALPRLREMLDESGVSLADVNVSEHSQEQTQEEQDSNKADNSQTNVVDDSTQDSLSGDSHNNINQMNLGLLDTYA